MRLAACLLVLAACSENRKPVSIEFVANWHDQAIGCADGELALSDLRFFVSELYLTSRSGAEHEIVLGEHGRWQQPGVALVDLESGEGGCRNGSPDTNAVVRGTVRDTDFISLRFTLGVPFEKNHANPLLADAPLDDPAMHWHWRSGYKFLRAGVVTPTDGFWLHLGSTGCEGTVQNISACRTANRVTVELHGYSPTSDRVAIDLATLFAAVDMHDGIASDCSSGPAEQSCRAPFAALGLLADTPHDQRRPVFSVLH